MKLSGDCGTADLIAAFQNDRLVARLGQVERGYESVMAAADDDDVAPLGEDTGLVVL
jgi:hypothetical protein